MKPSSASTAGDALPDVILDSSMHLLSYVNLERTLGKNQAHISRTPTFDLYLYLYFYHYDFLSFDFLFGFFQLLDNL